MNSDQLMRLALTDARAPDVKLQVQFSQATQPGFRLFVDGSGLGKSDP